MKNWKVKFYRYSMRQRGSDEDKKFVRITITMDLVSPNLIREFLDNDWEFNGFFPPHSFTKTFDDWR